VAQPAVPILLQSAPPKPDYVHCVSCGMCIVTFMAVKVKNTYPASRLKEHDWYYCHQHAPAYEERFNGNCEYKYYKRFEVDIDGTPIGYEKKEAQF
jgi:hypothetical protein